MVSHPSFTAGPVHTCNSINHTANLSINIHMLLLFFRHKCRFWPLYYLTSYMKTQVLPWTEFRSECIKPQNRHRHTHTHTHTCTHMRTRTHKHRDIQEALSVVWRIEGMRAKLLLSPTGAPQHVFLKMHTHKQNKGMKGGGRER